MSQSSGSSYNLRPRSRSGSPPTNYNLRSKSRSDTPTTTVNTVDTNTSYNLRPRSRTPTNNSSYDLRSKNQSYTPRTRSSYNLRARTPKNSALQGGSGLEDTHGDDRNTIEDTVEVLDLTHDPNGVDTDQKRNENVLHANDQLLDQQRNESEDKNAEDDAGYFLPLHRSRVFAKKLADLLNYWDDVGFTHGNMDAAVVPDESGEPIVTRPASEGLAHVPGLDLQTCLETVLNDIQRSEGSKNERRRVKNAVGFVRDLSRRLHNPRQQEHVQQAFGSFFRRYNDKSESLSILCKRVNDELRCTTHHS